ncbi:hypothetical protein BerOc1_01979 [Pseudodesulfovibrio hydrargyri]|uniref:Bifunctional 3-demethylubiquinone-9 3-methyltransferase/ 2-octaprenyl-6-hydroxy phenol methylase n=1 Tax=Pseudodesulfovibrio hydrargyri TaxID=2125990 RepID=A0A1J5NEA7_9BACT|nr:methyltransferase domain-containing protein [Pseudodesulfovibrio hydrargyri]OIQ50049.1 hypothetical protein BerOc1_01979 [Pseudodesulfovibrio hydrargyri]
MSKIFPCDLCGSDDAVEVPYARFYTDDQPIHICKGCGFVYVRERRSAKEIARTWSDELFGEIYTAAWPSVKARHKYVAEFVNNNIGLSGKSLVEVGGGEGHFLDLSREYDAQPFGIEPSKRNCKAMQSRDIPCFEGTIEDYAEQGGKQRFQVAASLWTVENCMSCIDMFNAIHDCLEEDGRVVVATGSRILTPFKKPLSYYLSTNPADSHSFRFSPNTLTGLLAETGFEVEHMNRHIDTDYLVVIGKKVKKGTKIEWQGDDYRKVHDYFERWHRETLHYL